ncbi:MAG: HAMP domain-containing sensor histidine kinase [bacterium]
MKYNSFPLKSDSDAGRLPSEIEQLVAQNESKLARTYVYSIIEKPNEQTPHLAFLLRMTGGELMILRKPLKGISESVSITNQFYVFAGLLIIFIGGLFTFVFSKKITRPIIEMSNVAEGISNLDFDKRVIHDSRDEIGNLGKSINKMSEKLRAGMNALQQDIQRRKQLVRNISHELKTPIGVIKGYAEGLRFGVADDKKMTKKYCLVIAEECNRMDNLVRELLSLSMLESGIVQLSTTHFNIGILIQQRAERLEMAIAEKGITLDLDLPTGLSLFADHELLERVIDNLITNAIHHAEGAKRIKVTAVGKGNGVLISVFNTGIPIPEEDLEGIWDVFYKVDKARSREYGGHGLGLSIVRSIAELHGGSAGVANVEGGVTFFIEIP